MEPVGADGFMLLLFTKGLDERLCVSHKIKATSSELQTLRANFYYRNATFVAVQVMNEDS